MLRVTLSSGASFEVALVAESSLTVTHPDQDTQSWVDVVKVETFDPNAPVVNTPPVVVPVEEPVVEKAPAKRAAEPASPAKRSTAKRSSAK